MMFWTNGKTRRKIPVSNPLFSNLKNNEKYETIMKLKILAIHLILFFNIVFSWFSKVFYVKLLTTQTRSDLNPIQNQKYNFLLWVGGFDCQCFVEGQGRGLTAWRPPDLSRGGITQKKLQSIGLHCFLFKPNAHAGMALGLNKKTGFQPAFSV